MFHVISKNFKKIQFKLLDFFQLFFLRAYHLGFQHSSIPQWIILQILPVYCHMYVPGRYLLICPAFALGCLCIILACLVHYWLYKHLFLPALFMSNNIYDWSVKDLVRPRKKLLISGEILDPPVGILFYLFFLTNLLVCSCVKSIMCYFGVWKGVASFHELNELLSSIFRIQCKMYYKINPCTILGCNRSIELPAKSQWSHLLSPAGAVGPGTGDIATPPVCLSVRPSGRPSVRPSRLVFAL